MSTYPPHHLEFVIDDNRKRITILEQQLAALQADIAAEKGEPEKAVEKARVVMMAMGDVAYWIVRRGDGKCFHPRVTDRHDPWRFDGFGMDRDIAEAVAAALNAREAKP